ncbi:MULTISPECIES: hypothetical protein [Rhodopirellula]|uniref:hypothetical protein n=1 Tax=Rhodopirellula TaxID=265488 RepID=UPI00257EB490|nr:hypothetical protein [Rhodopirellula sp. UBA1907]
MAIEIVGKDGQPQAAILNTVARDIIDSKLPLDELMGEATLLQPQLSHPGNLSSALGEQHQNVAITRSLLKSANDHRDWLQKKFNMAETALTRLGPRKSKFRLDPWYQKRQNSNFMPIPFCEKKLAVEIAVPLMVAVGLVALAVIGVASEFALFRSQIVAGSLYQAPAPSKLELPIEPGLTICVAVTFVPIICCLVGIKNISRRNRRHTDNAAQKVIGVVLLLGSLIALWLFSYFVVGEQTTVTAANVISKPTGLPWYLVALSSSMMALANTVALAGAIHFFGLLVQEVPAHSPVHEETDAEVTRWHNCIQRTNKTIGELTGYLERCQFAEREINKHLKVEYERREKQTKTSTAIDAASETLDEMRSIVDRLKKQTLGLLIAFAMTVLSGCHGTTSTDQASHGTKEVTPATEYFVFDDGSFSTDTTLDILSRLATDRIPGGSRLTVIHGPERQLVGGVDIPFGSATQRVSNSFFLSEWNVIETFYSDPPECDDEVPSVFGITQAVADCRRNADAPCRVICLGSLVYHDPNRPAFSMRDGLVPSPGWIEDVTSPFCSELQFPKSTLVECVVSKSNFGDNPRHNRLIRKFTSAHVAASGGYLTRISADLSQAGAFAKPFMRPVSFAPGSPMTMIETKIEEHREHGPKVKSIPIEVERPDLNVLLRTLESQPGSLISKIINRGGNPWSMSELVIEIVVVVDGSSSMSSDLEKNGQLLKRVGDELAPLVKELRIAFLVRSDQANLDFPLALIGYDDPNHERMDRFLDKLRTTGSDESFEVMLRDGQAAFDSSVKADRRILLVVSDHISGNAKSVSQSVASWVAQQPNCHRFIGVYTADNAQPDFEVLCGKTPGARVAPSGDALIDEVIALTN